MLIPILVQQIEAVDHPNLGLTLDFAHLYVAANACGFDYLDAVRQAAPYVRHLSRWYDYRRGRFVQADTIVPELGNPQSLNRYMYVRANPTQWALSPLLATLHTDCTLLPTHFRTELQTMTPVRGFERPHT